MDFRHRQNVHVSKHMVSPGVRTFSLCIVCACAHSQVRKSIFVLIVSIKQILPTAAQSSSKKWAVTYRTFQKWYDKDHFLAQWWKHLTWVASKNYLSYPVEGGMARQSHICKNFAGRMLSGGAREHYARQISDRKLP